MRGAIVKRIRECLAARIKTALILLILLVPFEALGAEYIGDIMQYSSTPPFLPRATDPNIHFLIDSSADMLRPAYGICDESMANCVDSFFHSTDDYDPHRPYYGTFDNNYSHLEDEARKKEINTASYPYKYDDSLSYKYSYATHGSNIGFEKDAAGGWNGNWLNWFAMTQMDIMKAVLVGGKISPTPETASSLHSGDIAKLMSYLDVLANDGKIYKIISFDNASGRVGYTNFSTPQEIAYDWYSAPAGATVLAEATAGTGYDATHFDYTLPFDFEYYGTTFKGLSTTIDIGLDGYVSLTDHATYYNTNTFLNTSSAPANLIAVYWDDQQLTANKGGRIVAFVEGTAPNRKLIISWEDISNDADTGKDDKLTYQLILTEGNQIITQYQKVDWGGGRSWDEGEAATIGVKNVDGSRTKLYSYNTNKIQDGVALHMTPDSMIYEVVPKNNSDTVIQPAGSLASGHDYDLTVLSYVTTKPAEGCDTTIGKYPNTSDAISDLCSDHPLEGLFHDLRSAAETGDLGFRLSIMEAGYNDDDGGEIIADANSIIVGSHFNPEIGQMRNMEPAGAAPLGEAMAESMYYFKQEAPIWSSDYDGEGAACAEAGVDSDGTPDPYCDRSGEMIPCCRSFVLLISSGLYRDDFGRNVYNDDHDTTADPASLDNPPADAKKGMGVGGENEGLPEYGGWIDNVAYKAHVTDIRTDLDGEQDLTLYVVNTYGEGVGVGTEILKRAAKYGGFDDKDKDGRYDDDVYDCDGDSTNETGEDDRDCDGLPDTYFEPSGDESVKDKITEAINAMLKGSASGTSVSVLSTSAGGQGAVYQAYFYPSKIEGENETRDYTGYMRAFFMDEHQNLRDDASGGTYTTGATGKTTFVGAGDLIAGNKKLDPATIADGGDYVARMHLDTENSLVRVALTEHATGENVPLAEAPYPDPDPLIDELVSVWEAGELMATRDKDERRIYTWADLDYDGVIDGGGVAALGSDFGGVLSDSPTDEIMLFNDTNSNTLARFLRADDPDGAFEVISGVNTGFLNMTTEAEDIIDFIRGEYVNGYRNRCITIRGNDDSETFDDASRTVSGIAESEGRRGECGVADGESDNGEVWPLGDIIYSTPTLVSGPGEKYDLIYGDASYREFKERFKDRRNMIYVGANDGMLHAFNAGFFHSKETKFCEGNVDTNSDGVINGDMGTSTSECATNGDYALGEEMWGFIPHENLPHMQFLACNGTSGDPSACGSSDYHHVFFMDQRPKATDVRIFENNSTTHPGGWGTIIVVGMRYGGGAMDINFNNSSTTIIDMPGEKIRSAYYVFDVTDPEDDPKLLYRFTDENLGFTVSYPAILRTEDGADEAWYVVFGSGPKNEVGDKDANRDYNSDATTTQAGYVYIKELGGNEAFRTFSTSTFGHSSVIMGDPSTVDINLDFNVDVIYIGSSQAATGGAVYRINTGDTPTDLTSWSFTTLIEDADMGPLYTPVSAGIGKIGGDFWIYFGTGRLRSSDDIDDVGQQRFYGIKDPCAEQSGGCAAYTKDDLYPSVEIEVSSTGVVTPGSSNACADVGEATCSYSSLIAFATKASIQGWYLDLDYDNVKPSERVLARSVVLGGTVMFTTYTPVSSVCDIFGTSNLYGLDMETGAAREKALFVGYEKDADGNDTDVEINATEIQKKISLGAGMPTAIGVAVGETVTGFVQKSTGEIIRVESEMEGHASGGMSSWREKTKSGGAVEIEQTYKNIIQ